MHRSLHVLSLCFVLAGLSLLADAPALAAGDAAKGQKTFNKCKACHSLEAGQNKIGPSLHGLFGRTAGTVEGYKYSQAMADSGVVWGEKTISEYLADPKGYIPGNKMTFVGVREEDERQDVIAYLKGATQ